MHDKGFEVVTPSGAYIYLSYDNVEAGSGLLELLTSFSWLQESVN
jgi:hypothetical protein